MPVRHLNSSLHVLCDLSLTNHECNPHTHTHTHTHAHTREQAVRELGLGPGGFYPPSYSGGGRLQLRMMCLGLHWEPRTSKYEATR